MLEDQDAAEEEDEAVPPRARVTTHELRRVRAWRNEPNVEAADQADLSADRAYLPADRRSKAEVELREALRFYLGVAHLEHRPGPDVLARHLRAVATSVRSLRRVLLA